MIVRKELQDRILKKYINEKHNLDECSGFVDGVNATIEIINKLYKQNYIIEQIKEEINNYESKIKNETTILNKLNPIDSCDDVKYELGLKRDAIGKLYSKINSLIK